MNFGLPSLNGPSSILFVLGSRSGTWTSLSELDVILAHSDSLPFWCSFYDSLRPLWIGPRVRVIQDHRFQSFGPPLRANVSAWLSGEGGPSP